MSDIEDVKPFISSLNCNFINLNLHDWNGYEIKYKIKSSAELQKIMNSYSERVNVTINDLKFLYDGKRVHGYETPKSLGMQNDDIIDVFSRQDGGINLSTIK